MQTESLFWFHASETTTGHKSCIINVFVFMRMTHCADCIELSLYDIRLKVVANCATSAMQFTTQAPGIFRILQT